MALANFFNRTAQALGQVLSSPDHSALLKQLENNNVALVFDNKAIRMANCSTILNLSVNLLARLYPKISLIYQGKQNAGLKLLQELTDLAVSINPEIEIIHTETELDVSLCIGSPVIECDHKIFVAAESWNVEVSINEPVKTVGGGFYNPLSAAVAACFGVGEVFKQVFCDLLPISKSTPSSFTFSLLDYSKNPSKNEELPLVTFKDVTLVGLGAVGNGMLWCLEHIPQLKGSIHLVDHENVDLSNLQRYVLTTQKSVGVFKTELAKLHLERNELSVEVFPLRFGSYVESARPNCIFDVIAVAVDNAEDRVAVQAVLPKLVFNGWTGLDGDLGVSHHYFDSHNACLACMYLATGKTKSYTERIAEIIGFDPMRTASLIVRKETLSKELLEEIAASMDYPKEILLNFEGKTLSEFYSSAICGGVLIKLKPGSDDMEAVVPLAHQSTLTGVLLATELVKNALGLINKDTPVETRLNALAPPPEYVVFNRGKTTNPKCICLDEDYLTVYRQKYSS